MEKNFPIKIGLEVHGYLNTREKLFCMCKSHPDTLIRPQNIMPTQNLSKLSSHPNSLALFDTPNSRICPICTGTPGSKPMLPNKKAMEQLVKVALVLGCKVNHDKDLIWQRKHYEYPDLPKGYQNTISGGHAVFPAHEGKFGGIGITEVHLEEDPAKYNPETGKLDFNRSGLALIEIVTEPDFKNAGQVVEWLRNLIHALSYIKAIRKNAGIKADVNVSTYGERVEIKNLNSIEKIKEAIEYEIARQLEEYEKGVVQKRETLAFDEKLGRTIKMREKEGQADYRFISEPDLPVINLNVKEIKKLHGELPEMPGVKLDKLIKKFKLGEKDAKILTRNLELVEFVEKLSKIGVDVKKNISWITVELLRVLNYNKKTLEDDDVCIEPGHLAELIKEVEAGKITRLKAKQIMNDFVPKSFSISKKGDIGKIADVAVENLCKQVINKNKKAVEDYKSGKEEALNWLVGGVMRASERRADHRRVKEILKELLK